MNSPSNPNHDLYPENMGQMPSERKTQARAHVTKIFNFPVELADELRKEATRRSQQAGYRITEKEIVIQALEHLLRNPHWFPEPRYSK